MKQLSSLEIKAIVDEISFLKNSCLEQIYQEEDSFLFVVYQKEKYFLRVVFPSLIFLSRKEKGFPPPTNFCLFLRKCLNRKRIKEIEQIKSERIVKIVFEDCFLFIELFSHGNLILCNKEGIILECLRKEVWKTRRIKPKEKYQFPPPQFDFLHCSLPEMEEKIKQSQKDSLVKCLAAEVGLGKIYAEEVCLRSGLRKDLEIKKAGKEEAKKLHLTIQELIKETGKKKSFVYQNEPFPVFLQHFKGEKEFSSFSQAIEFSYQEEKSEKPNPEKERLKFVIKEQEEKIKELEKEEKECFQKGEFIYQNYALINQIIESLKNNRTNDLKKENKFSIKEINFREKKAIISF